MVESNFYLLFTIYHLPDLAVTTRFSQVVVNHPAPILPRFGRGGVAALFVAADLVLGVETFEDELAGGEEQAQVRALEVEGDEGVVDEVGDGFEEADALVRRSGVGELEVVAGVEPADDA